MGVDVGSLGVGLGGVLVGDEGGEEFGADGVGECGLCGVDGGLEGVVFFVVDWSALGCGDAVCGEQ